MRNPIPTPPANEAGKVERHVLCRHYGLCLDFALVNDWPGFSCRKCKAETILDWDPETWWEDAIACSELLSAIFGTPFIQVCFEKAQDHPMLERFRLLGTVTVSRILGISTSEVLELCSLNELDHVIFGKSIMIKTESLREFIANGPRSDLG